jgi:hypothetical protein
VKPREKGADNRLCRDQRGRVEPFWTVLPRDGALRLSAGPLDDRFAPEIGSRDLEGASFRNRSHRGLGHEPHPCLATG